MTNTITIQGTRVGPTEADVLAMFGADLDSSEIVNRTGLAPTEVSRILGAIPGGGRAGAARMAAIWFVRSGFKAASSAPATGEAGEDGISAIVARAIATERPAFITAADRISDLADELEARLAEHEKTAELQAEAAKLEARLAEIRSQLPKATTGRRRSEPAVDSKKVRAWAAGQGIAIRATGRVPADVVTAYEKAMAGS